MKRMWAHNTEILAYKKGLKNYRRFIRVFEGYSFNRILDTGKLVNFYEKSILFLDYEKYNTIYLIR